MNWVNLINISSVVASPSQFNTWNADANVWNVNSDGNLNNNWTSNSWLGVRPRFLLQLVL